VFDGHLYNNLTKPFSTVCLFGSLLRPNPPNRMSTLRINVFCFLKKIFGIFFEFFFMKNILGIFSVKFCLNFFFETYFLEKKNP
jgi:hypothetical protein